MYDCGKGMSVMLDMVQHLVIVDEILLMCVLLWGIVDRQSRQRLLFPLMVEQLLCRLCPLLFENSVVCGMRHIVVHIIRDV